MPDFTAAFPGRSFGKACTTGNQYVGRIEARIGIHTSVLSCTRKLPGQTTGQSGHGFPLQKLISELGSSRKTRHEHQDKNRKQP